MAPPALTCDCCNARATHVIPLPDGTRAQLCDRHAYARFGPLGEYRLDQPDDPYPII